MSGKSRKKTAGTKPEKRAPGGALMGLRGGIKKIAGNGGGREKPPSFFSKICDAFFYIALLAFLLWFLYKNITL